MKYFYSMLLLSAIAFNTSAQVQTRFSKSNLLSESGVFGSPPVKSVKELGKVDVFHLMEEDT